MSIFFLDDDVLAALNAEASSLISDDINGVDAIKAVASRHDFEVVAECDQCIAYRTPTGILVNAWIDAPSEGICDGGMGFDDQIEWATDGFEDRP